MEISFLFDADSGGYNGRTKAVEGEWVFNLEKWARQMHLTLISRIEALPRRIARQSRPEIRQWIFNHANST